MDEKLLKLVLGVSLAGTMLFADEVFAKNR